MKKKIVIIVSALNMGGTQRNVSILCNNWSDKGYKVTIIYTNTLKSQKKNYFKLNKKVRQVYIKKSIFSYKFKTINLLYKLFFIRQTIKKLKPDVTISFLTRMNIANVLSNFGLNYFTVISERTYPPFRTLNMKFLWFYRILFKNINKIIVQTKKNKFFVEKFFPRIETHVIPNPIVYPIPNNGNICSPNLYLSKNKKVILGAGRLHKSKQFDILIKAYSEIKDKHQSWDLVILGDGEEKKNLNDLIKKLEISNRVHLIGSVGNMQNWYEVSDLFVLTSSFEGFPNVLLEAMSCGLPCISFDCDTGPSEIINNGINGILIKPTSKYKDLSKVIDRVIRDPNLLKNISDNAIFSREKYSVNNIIKKWNEILEI